MSAPDLAAALAGERHTVALAKATLERALSELISLPPTPLLDACIRQASPYSTSPFDAIARLGAEQMGLEELLAEFDSGEIAELVRKGGMP